MTTYAVGYFALAVLVAATVGFDIEDGSTTIPYALMCFLCAMVARWWGLLLVPALHQYVLEPLRHEILRGDLPLIFLYDREMLVLAGTVGIAAGLLVRALFKRGSTPRGRAHA